MKETSFMFIAIFSLFIFMQSCDSAQDNSEDIVENLDVEEVSEDDVTAQSEEEATKEARRDDKLITNFIQILKDDDKAALADLFLFPLKRGYPTPDIENEEEFIKHRYDEVFDKDLLSTLINSQLDDWKFEERKTQWGDDQYRYFFVKNGHRVSLTDDGQIHNISEIKAAKKIQSAIIKAEKKALHPSIRTFENSITVIETRKFKIRIDDLGKGNYRYASWEVDQKMSEKPDLIIENGTFHRSGTCGNHLYEFRNNNYFYLCGITPCGTIETPPAELTVFKDADPEKAPYEYDDDLRILYQDAKVSDLKSYYRAFYDALD